MPERQVISSLTGTVAPLLSVDAKDKRQLMLGSFWLPRAWRKSSTFVTDDVIIAPTNTSGLNLEMNYEVSKASTLISDAALLMEFPPITVTPAGNQASFVDFTGLALIDHFTTLYGSNRNYDHRDYDLYFDKRKMYGIEKGNAYDRMTYGNTSTAQRSALLLNGTVPGSPLIVPLLEPFSMDPSDALPIVVFAQKTRFVLRTKALQNFSTVQLTVPPTTLSFTGQFVFHLLFQYVHTTGEEASALLELSRAPDGISYMIHQHVRQDSDDFASQTSNFEIVSKLSSVTKPIKSLTWALIPTRLVNNTGFNDIFFFAPNPPAPIPNGMSSYSPIQSWSIEANGLIIQRRIPRDVSRFLRWYQTYEGFAGEDVFVQNYAIYPLAVNAASGYLDYTNLNNPVLRITTGPGGTGVDPLIPLTPQSLRLLVNAIDYNFWFFKSGNWSRTFN